MNKLRKAIEKETLLLFRDLFGFIILFLMPVILIITITSIQHKSENAISDIKVPMIVSNQDKGSVSKDIIDEMKSNPSFDIDLSKGSDKKPLIDKINSGQYQILLVLPDGLSNHIKSYTQKTVNNVMNSFMPNEEAEENSNVAPSVLTKEVEIYFDPTLNKTFRDNVINNINNYIYRFEKEAIQQSFKEEFDESADLFNANNLIALKEFEVTASSIKPNAVEQNLPAWTLFAIFFIVIPLSINIVKEKNQGTFTRILTLPVKKSTWFLAKIIVYLIVCLLQFYAMLLISIYLFPYLGLPKMNYDGKLFLMSVIALFSGLAAIGLGVLIGTVAKSHEQAAPFGSTLVVILAALGGLWFPVYAMPEFMQKIAGLSPMNWGLTSFHNVLLRNQGLSSILPELLLLFLFFSIMIIIALVYERKVIRG